VGAGAGDRVAVGNGPAGAAVDKECTSHQFLPKRGRFETKKLQKSRKKCKKRSKIVAKNAQAMPKQTNCRKRRRPD
jgi:hypothetical protein